MATASPYEKFLKTLRAARVAKGFSQGTLAKDIHLSRAQYTAIENGRSMLSYVHLHNLSVALGVKFTIGASTATPASRYAPK